MNVKNLITMLNQIGSFFISQPNQEKATHDLAEHVRLYWEPRMRSSIFDYLVQHPDGKSSEGELLPIVLTALTQYQAKLEPKTSEPT